MNPVRGWVSGLWVQGDLRRPQVQACFVVANSAASLGTGEGQHSQAQHARELRRDTGQDHKPEYAERGRWRSYNFANFPWRSDFSPDRLAFERFEKRTHKHYAKFGLHLCLLAPPLIFSARGDISQHMLMRERNLREVALMWNHYAQSYSFMIPKTKQC